ncbi:MAG: single-stranded-DNA-specific exonuclease RecJ, partial [Flavobacteriaceae bacterium]
MIKKSWKYKPEPDPAVTARLMEELKIPEAVAQLLAQRGVTNYQLAKDFFRPDWTHLHDPFLMRDMDVAVARIQKAIADKESIMIFGD